MKILSIMSTSFLLFLAAVNGAEAGSWICNATDAAGYRQINGNYFPQTFTASDSYLVRRYNVGVDSDPNFPYNPEPPKYVALELGNSSVWYFWGELEGSAATNSLQGPSDMTFFSQANLLVISHVTNSIIVNDASGTDYTPMFSIAKCARTG